MPELIDKIKNDPDFATLSAAEKRDIIGRALDKDPDYTILPPSQQPGIRSQILSQFKDTPSAKPLVSPIAKPAIPNAVPKTPEQLGRANPHDMPYTGAAPSFVSPPATKPMGKTPKLDTDGYIKDWLSGDRPDAQPAQTLQMMKMNPPSRWNELLQGYSELGRAALMRKVQIDAKADKAAKQSATGKLSGKLGDTMIGAAKPAPPPSAIDNALSVLGIPAGLRNAALFSLQNMGTDVAGAIANGDPNFLPNIPGKEGISLRDAQNVKRLQQMGLLQRARELSGSDMRALGRPDAEARIQQQYANKSGLGKVVERVGVAGINIATDPLTIAAGLGGVATDALRAASVARKGTTAGKLLGTAAKGANVVNKAGQAGFAAQGLAAGAKGIAQGAAERDPGKAVEGALMAALGTLGANHLINGSHPVAPPPKPGAWYNPNAKIPLKPEEGAPKGKPIDPHQEFQQAEAVRQQQFEQDKISQKAVIQQKKMQGELSAEEAAQQTAMIDAIPFARSAKPATPSQSKLKTTAQPKPVEAASATPNKDLYKSRIDALDAENKLTDISKLSAGDFIHVPATKQSSGATGFVKKIGRTNVTIETQYGGWANADSSPMELTVKKSDIAQFAKPKPQPVETQSVPSRPTSEPIAVPAEPKMIKTPSGLSMVGASHIPPKTAFSEPHKSSYLETLQGGEMTPQRSDNLTSKLTAYEDSYDQAMNQFPDKTPDVWHRRALTESGLTEQGLILARNEVGKPAVASPGNILFKDIKKNVTETTPQGRLELLAQSGNKKLADLASAEILRRKQPAQAEPVTPPEAPQIVPETPKQAPYKATLFHGSGRPLDTLEVGMPRATDAGTMGEGVYLSPHEHIADWYSQTGTNPTIHTVDVNLKNPLVLKGENRTFLIENAAKALGVKAVPEWDGAKQRSIDFAMEFTSVAKKAGHDGVIWEKDGTVQEVNAFDAGSTKVTNRKSKNESAQVGASSTQPTAAPKVETAPTSAVADASRMRMRDVEAFAKENNISLEDKSTYSEPVRNVIARAIEHYDTILHSLKNYDPAKNPNATLEERWVAADRQRKIVGEIAEAEKAGDQGKVNQLLAESEPLSKFLHRTGSEQGRGLQFQKTLIGEPHDVVSVLTHAEAMTNGNLGQAARRSLIDLAGKAEAEKARIDEAVKTKAETPNQNRPADYGKKNTIVREETYRKAVASLQEKRKGINVMSDPTGAQGAYHFAKVLPELIQIGAYHIEARIRSFPEWTARMREDSGLDLTEGEAQTIWASAKEELRKQNGQPKQLMPQTFADRLRQKLGSEGAVSFLDAIADEEGNPHILNKLLDGTELSAAEKKAVQDAWNANRANKTGKKQPATDAEKALSAIITADRKQASRAMTPEQRLKAQITATTKRIAALEREVATGQKPTKPQASPVSSPELNALKKRRDELVAQRDAKAKTEREAGRPQREINAGIKAANKRIAELEDQITTGVKPTKATATKATSPELETLRQKRDALQKQWDIQSRQPKPPKPTPTTTAPTLTERAGKALGSLGKPSEGQRRLAVDVAAKAEYEYAQGAKTLADFSRGIQKTMGETMKPEQLEKMFRKAAEDYARDYKSLDDIKGEMAKTIQQERYRQKSFGGKAAHWAGEATQAGTSLKATFDLSGLLRQGGVMAITHPGKVGAKGFTEMLAAAKDEATAKAIHESIVNGANGELYKKAGLEIVEHGENAADWRKDEQFVSNLVGKIPVLGKAHLASERAYVTVGNVMRARLFDTLYNPKMNDAEARDLARYINIASGRADLSPTTAQGIPLLARAIWSPRFAISRVQYLTGVPLIKASSWQTRKIIAREYGNYAFKIAIGMYLAKQMGAQVETDRRSSDFGTIRAGKVEFDMTSGLKQYVRVASQLATGQTKDRTGKITPTDDKATIGNFVRGKMNPAVGLGYDLAAKRKDAQGKRTDPTGKPYTPGKVVRSAIMPLGLQQAYEGIEENGASPQTARDVMAAFALDFFGMSANVRDRRKEAVQREAKKLLKR
jgi:hypothetical protein